MDITEAEQYVLSQAEQCTLLRLNSRYIYIERERDIDIG